MTCAKKSLALALLAVLATNVSAQSAEATRAVITKLVPGATISGVEDGPIRGWKEVTYNGSNVAYVLDGGKHVVFGNLVRSADSFSYTVDRIGEIRNGMLAAIPENQAIHYDAYNEKARLIVFTDVSCSFCVTFHTNTIPELRAQGVSVTYYPWPRGGKASPAYVVMRDIWCSADPKAALSAYMANPANHAKPKPGCALDFEASIETGSRLGMRGTPGVFNNDGQDMGGALPALMLLEKLGITPK